MAHPKTPLDLVFAMDCTGSMSGEINKAQQSIHSIVDEILRHDGSSVNLGLVKYRDHPPEDTTFITDVLHLTSSVDGMKEMLNECTANGGGDTPEAVADALHEVLQMSWRSEATKVGVLVADAPPHGLAGSVGDHFPEGCPLGYDPMRLAHRMAARGITLYVIGCRISKPNWIEFFTGLALATGGQYVPLHNASSLAAVIIGGAREEISLNHLMPVVRWMVAEETKKGGAVDVEAVVETVYSQLRKAAARSTHLVKDNIELPAASAQAQQYAGMTSMQHINTSFPLQPSTSPVASGHGAGAAFVTSPNANYGSEEGGVSKTQVDRMVRRCLAQR